MPTPGKLPFVFSSLLLFSALLALVGCSGNSEEIETSDGLQRMSLQANWYAQVSHGGFHQGLAKGIYQKHGIEIEMLEAGPGTKVIQRVASGDADIGMARFDSIAQAADKGIPVVAIAAFMYHDAAAFMVREDSPVKRFEDLEGKRVMLGVGSTFEAYFRRRFQIDFQAQPFTWGYGEFLVDPSLIQQCYVTNEPFFVQRNGVSTRLLPFHEAGYDPPQVLFASRSLLEKRPEAVRAFLAATVEGWLDFLDNDPQPGLDSVKQHNPKLDDEHMRYAYDVLVNQDYLKGEPEVDWVFGTMPREKLGKVIAILQDLDLVSMDLSVEDCVNATFLP